ncbi:MAG: hypothetical protein AB7U29_03465 [Desulfobulbus sp.]
MRKTKAIDINGTTYMVRELTPLEIDQLFDQSKSRSRTIVDDILDVHCLDTVLLGSMLGVEPPRCSEIIGPLTPSEYMPIIEAAKELNPDFFEMARRWVDRAGQLGEISKIIGKISESASESLSSTDIVTPGITA